MNSNNFFSALPGFVSGVHALQSELIGAGFVICFAGLTTHVILALLGRSTAGMFGSLVRLALIPIIILSNLAHAKPPNPLKAIASLEEKFDMHFKEELPIKDGTKIWIFESNETVHEVPVIIEVPPFPSEEIIKAATMSAAGEVELIFILKTQHDNKKDI